MGQFQYKYGKKPAIHKDGQELYGLAAVLKEALPPAPSRFGFGLMFTDWGMLGNDTLGDCAIAGPEHETMIFTRLGPGPAANFTVQTAIEDYSSIAGYVPGDPNTDQGTDVSVLMDYRRKTGMLDAANNHHKIELAVRLPLRDWNTFIRSVHTFGAIAVGFEVPQSAEDQFANDQIWDYVGDWNILGGHYVPAVGSMNSSHEVSVITWGRRQRMTKSFWNEYVDELWLPLSAEVVKAGYGLNHIEWSRVEQLAQSL